MKCAACGFDDQDGYQFIPIFFDVPPEAGREKPNTEQNKAFYMRKGNKIYSTLHACPHCGTVKIDI